MNISAKIISNKNTAQFTIQQINFKIIKRNKENEMNFKYDTSNERASTFHFYRNERHIDHLSPRQKYRIPFLDSISRSVDLTKNRTRLFQAGASISSVNRSIQTSKKYYILYIYI